MIAESPLAHPLPSRWRWKTFVTLGCVLIGSALVLLLANGVHRAREAARCSQCTGHMNQIAMALYNYHDTYGCFPPAYVADDAGRPQHSWRVLLLPFLDQQEVYAAYDFSEPWNGPKNSLLAHRIRNEMFHCPSGTHATNSPLTDYAIVVGSTTLFPGTEVRRLEDITDGPENTVLLVEIAHSNLHWMEPRDIPLDSLSLFADGAGELTIASPHDRGPGVVFADGIQVTRLDRSLSKETFHTLLTIDGKEPSSRKLRERYDEHRGRYLAE